MRPFFLLLLFLGSCTGPFGGASFDSAAAAAQTLSPKKQKQKIASLQKKLETAEKEQAKLQEEVEDLKREVRHAQIESIERQVLELDELMLHYRNRPELFAKRLPKDPSSLFLEERELLHQLIQEGPSPTAFEAQLVLDQILRVITEYNDLEPY